MSRMKNLKHVKFTLDWLKAEAEPDLDIPELSKTGRADVLELVDWELKRVGEAQKTFGVTAWSLLVGFAAITWIFASMPNLAKIDIRQVLWAFVLLESALLLGTTIWTLVLNHSVDTVLDRAVRFSTLGGVAAKPSIAVLMLRLATLLAVSFSLPLAVPDEVRFATRAIIVFALLFFAALIVLLRCDIPVLAVKENPNVKKGREVFSGVLNFCLLIGPMLVLPSIVWSWALTLKCLPEMEDFRSAGLLVAAGYLLRLLLVSNAQSRHQPFLEQLRRDVALGFLTPEKAAFQLSWRVSGLPSGIYVNGRLRALTAELSRLATRIRDNMEKLSRGAKTFQELPKEQQASKLESLSKWLEDYITADTAQKTGHYAKHRASFFLAFSSQQAKGTKAYAEWEAACEAVEAAGKEYSQVRASLDSLLQQVRAADTTLKSG